MDEKITFAVFWRMKPSEYEPEPEWRPYSMWLADYDIVAGLRNEAIRNPRCAEVVIFERTEHFEEVPGSRFGGAGC